MVTAVQTGLLPEDEQHHIPILKGEPQSDNVSEEKEKSLKGLAHKFKHLFTSAERKVVSTTKRFTDLLHVHTQVKLILIYSIVSLSMMLGRSRF